MFVLAILVLAPCHKVEEAWHADVHLFFVGEAALSVRKFALSQGVIDAGFSSEVVGELAAISGGAIVFVVEFLADLFGGFWLDDLSFEGV